MTYARWIEGPWYVYWSTRDLLLHTDQQQETLTIAHEDDTPPRHDLLYRDAAAALADGRYPHEVNAAIRAWMADVEADYSPEAIAYRARTADPRTWGWRDHNEAYVACDRINSRRENQAMGNLEVTGCGQHGIWVPLSVIHDDSQIFQAGQTDGTLIVARWWAVVHGWVDA